MAKDKEGRTYWHFADIDGMRGWWLCQWRCMLAVGGYIPPRCRLDWVRCGFGLLFSFFLGGVVGLTVFLPGSDLRLHRENKPPDPADPRDVGAEPIVEG